MISLLLTAALAVPPCVEAGERSPQEALTQDAPADDPTLLARLVHAEATSTGFPDDAAVHRAIAWVVAHRVRLAAASPRSARRYGEGVGGVIFRPAQFNPAVSARSRYSTAFLCPTDEARWGLATAAAAEALSDRPSPFLQTDWERAHGLSLVLHVYYPRSVQARGPEAPWEDSDQLLFLGDVSVGDLTVPAERLRLYRTARPPSDVRPTERDGQPVSPSAP